LLALFAITDKDSNREKRSIFPLQNKFEQGILGVHFGQELDVVGMCHRELWKSGK